MTCDKCSVVFDIGPVIELCPKHAAVEELIEALKHYSDTFKWPKTMVNTGPARAQAVLRKAGER